MKSFILYFGIALFLGYAAYKIFWDIKWLIESFKKNDEKETAAAKKSVGKITLILLVGAAACALLIKLFQ